MNFYLELLAGLELEVPGDVGRGRGEEDDVGLEVGVVEGRQRRRLDVQHTDLRKIHSSLHNVLKVILLYLKHI